MYRREGLTIHHSIPLLQLLVVVGCNHIAHCSPGSAHLGNEHREGIARGRSRHRNGPAAGPTSSMKILVLAKITCQSSMGENCREDRVVLQFLAGMLEEMLRCSKTYITGP
jgi:hypothetical protein